MITRRKELKFYPTHTILEADGWGLEVKGQALTSPPVPPKSMQAEGRKQAVHFVLSKSTLKTFHHLQKHNLICKKHKSESNLNSIFEGAVRNE